MTITASISELAILLVAIALTVLIVFIIVAVFRLKAMLKALEEFLIESRKTVEGLNYIVKRAGDQTGDIEELIKKFKETGLKATSLANMVLDHVKSPLISIISLLIGLEFGLNRLKKKGGGEDGDNAQK